ncbi:hypothetical protein MSAS_22760 [Mycobacterium saskatchewanense]|nr:hypothetical protein MSAS_22760 [Mycobacterium saskatchewanense]
MADQDGPHSVVAAQKVAAADYQDRAPAGFEVVGGFGGSQAAIVRGQGQTIPLMTNWDNSLPVLPSYACTVHTRQESKLRAT